MNANLTRLRDAASAATPGPWNHDHNGFIGPFKDGEWLPAVAMVANMKDADISEQDRANANFIAAASPSTVLKLIEVVELRGKAVEFRASAKYQEAWSLEKQADAILSTLSDGGGKA